MVHCKCTIILNDVKSRACHNSFVNNTNIVEVHLTKTEITIENVYISMQKSINGWEGLLKATGGAIRPDKSFVYPISFIWYDRGDYSFKNPKEHDMGFTLNNEFVEIE